METDAHEDGPAYLIEREEKLRGIRCAVALVDQNHCRGSRSLRWDLLAARVPRGILHAKVSLLAWTRRIRIMVASANLTEPGYRQNQEVFGVLDFHEEGPHPEGTLSVCLDFLEGVVRYANENGTAESAPIKRWRDLIQYVRDQAGRWKLGEEGAGRKSVRVQPVFILPGGPSMFRQIDGHWPENTRPDSAWVTSPFFNRDDGGNRPEEQVWDLLRRRGPVELTYNLTGEDAAEGLVLHGPQSLRDTLPPGRPQATVAFKRLPLQEKDGEHQGVLRPLHAKSLWLEGGDWIAYCIGSSNFTRAGTGIVPGCNIEANLLYQASRVMLPEAVERMESAYLEGEPVPGDAKVTFLPLEDQEDQALQGVPLLPPAFGSAVFHVDRDLEAVLKLSIAGESPAHWRVLDPEKGAALLVEAEWQALGSPSEITLPWKDHRPPSGLEVEWEGSGGRAWWPVNVDSPSSLPPPSELRNLPLDILIQVLTSARPLHEAIRFYLKRKGRASGDGAEFRDAHDRVDVSGFLLQRTRRASWALHALRSRLERPVPTLESLEWRLRGPIGAQAVLDAIERECSSEAERRFLRAETCLELSQVNPSTSPGCVPAKLVAEEIRRFILEILDRESQSELEIPELSGYLGKVRERVSV